MATKILIVFYSLYGRSHQLSQAVAHAARAIADTEVKLLQVPEPVPSLPDL